MSVATDVITAAVATAACLLSTSSSFSYFLVVILYFTFSLVRIGNALAGSQLHRFRNVYYKAQCRNHSTSKDGYYYS